MKHYFQIALVGAILTFRAFAISFPEPAELKTLPADKVWDLYLESVEYPDARAEILNSIFENERIDIIRPFFTKYYDSQFKEFIIALPDSGYKNRIVLEMLRLDSPFWYRLPPPLEADGSRGVTYNNAVEPLVGVIQRYLPEVLINEELFSTKAGRLKLAADLENAMLNPKSGTHDERSQKRNRQREEDSLFEVDGKTQASLTSEPSRSISPEKPKHWWHWVFILFALVGIGGVLWGKRIMT